MFRNPHLAAPAAESAAPEGADLPRVRFVTNDPAREYAQRPGSVEPLPNSIAALILCKTGFARVERHQIKVTIDGTELFFTSADSVTIADKNGTGERVAWALNRQRPDLLHILTAEGAYVESIPRKGEGEWFVNSEASQRARSTAKRLIARDGERLAHLHAPDTRASDARDARNAAELQRVVSTFPAATSQAAERSSFPEAERFAAAETSAEEQRKAQKQRAAADRRRVVPLSDFLPRGAEEPTRAASTPAPDEADDFL
jgi:hypothetical protein